MSEIIIEYWPIRGRAEVMRLALSAKNVPWALRIVDRTAMKTDRELFPFGQCPRLIDGDLSLVQSNAILRYLARKLDLNGSTEAEACTIDMILEGVESIRAKYAPLIYQDELADAAKATYWATHGDKASADERNGGAHFDYLASFVTKSSSGFVVGDALSMADLALFDIVDMHVRIFPDEMKATYPELIAHHQKVESCEGVKEYRSSDRLSQQVNGNPLG